MKIQHSVKPNSKSKTILLPYFEDEVNYAYIKQVTGVNIQSDFKGELKENALLYKLENRSKIYLLGLGKKKELENQAHEAFRHIAFFRSSAWTKTVEVDISHLSTKMAYHAALGIRLASYSPNELKSDSVNSKTHLGQLNVRIVHPDTSARGLAKEGQQTAETQSAIMDLVNSPANIKTPTYLAAYAKRSGKENGFSVKVMYKKELIKQGLHALLAVGQGSINEPAFIIMEYKPSSQKKSKKPQLGLVGKGITFDTGGISIKGANNMHYMKSDMGGAAAVIGAIELASKIKLDIHLVAIVPAAENAVDANSIRPGDVIQSYSGKTIEIIDTDAEGRLVLADGLSYLQRNFSPDIIIDLATLTGSCVRTFGYAAAGLFTKNERLSKQLQEAGNQTHQRLWPLPMWGDYDSDIASDLADVRNFSGKPVAGAISAAKFLEFFIKDHPAWAHLDIAGVAFGDSEYTKMKSAKGYGVRLLITYMKNLIKQS